MLTRVVAGVVDVVVIAPAYPTALVPSPVRKSATVRERDRWKVLTLRRGPNTRCTGAWEIVHGRIEAGEHAENAAVREVGEETGLVVQRLYSITVNAFYLPRASTVQLALVFAAIVDHAAVRLGDEHDAFRWRTFSGASKVLAWPREREALNHVQQLLKDGDAGPVEDVLRVF